MRSSIRREVKAGGRAFLIHVEEVNYPTRRAARAGIITLEAAAIVSQFGIIHIRMYP